MDTDNQGRLIPIQLKKINKLISMKLLSLILVCTLLAGGLGYAIEGTWASTDYNNSRATVTALSTALNGLNNYNLQLEGCPSLLAFSISESYFLLSNAGKVNCDGGPSSSAALMSSLQQKFFYFQIYYDQLLLVNIYGNKSLSFVRAKIDMRNYNEVGVFSIKDGAQVTITNQSIFLCNNSLRVDYSGNSKDSLSIVNHTVAGSCNDNASQTILEKLAQAEYYRLENPSVLRIYGANYSSVFELNREGNWNGTIPILNSPTGNNQTNSIALNDSLLNNSSKSTSSQKNSQTVPKLNSSANTTSQLNSSALNTSKANTSTAQGTSATTIQNTSSASQSSSTANASQSSSSSSSQSSSSASTQTSSSSSESQSGTDPSMSGSSSSSMNVKLTFSLAAALWYPEFFMVFDQSTWPSKVAINATNIAFIGCNTVTIPMIINYSNLTVTIGNTITQSRKQCGSVDQPYIDLIKNSSSISANANDTAFRMTFYDKEHKTLFAIARNYTIEERKNLVYAATNPASSSITVSLNSNQSNSSNAQGSKQTNNSIATQSTSSTSTSTSTSTASASTSTSISSSSSTASTSSTSSASTTASASSSATSTLASASSNAASTSPATILVGRYNPSRIGTISLPSVLTQNTYFIFTPAFVFITGTCNSYVYPYSVEQQGTNSVISVSTANRQVQANPTCDSSNDLLYIQPFEQSRSFTLAGGVNLNFADNAGNPTFGLTKVVPNSAA